MADFFCGQLFLLKDPKSVNDTFSPRLRAFKVSLRANVIISGMGIKKKRSETALISSFWFIADSVLFQCDH